MGNTHSMNNLSLLDQQKKLNSSEFLRYSQIPYENHYFHEEEDPNNCPNNHLPSHIKVLPQLTPEHKLRSTNNGVIIQSGGTISGGKKDLDVIYLFILFFSFNFFFFFFFNYQINLHRSKSISETQSSYQNNHKEMKPSSFSMHRSSTQLSMSYKDSLTKENCHNFAEENLSGLKKNRAPQPPNKTNDYTKSNSKVRKKKQPLVDVIK